MKRLTLPVASLMAVLCASGPVVAQERYEGGVRLAGVELVKTAELRVASMTTQRYEQRYQGLPVLGGAVAVRLNAGGVAQRTVVEVARGLDLVTKASVSEASAAARAAAVVGGAAEVLGLAVQPSAGVSGGGWLVWQVNVATGFGGEQVLIDARSGALRGRRPLGADALGRVYALDPVQTPATSDLELAPLADDGARLTSEDGQVAVYQFTGGGLSGGLSGEQSLGPSVGADFLYDSTASIEPNDPFALVNAYFHVGRMRSFFGGTLGVDMSGPSWKLGVLVNARLDGAPLDNAFYSSIGMSSPKTPNVLGVGQGKYNFSYDSDALLHEFAHYVTQNAVGFSLGQFGSDDRGYTTAASSIDEGVADYFACSVNGDSIIGEILPKSWQRDLSQGGKRCPDDMTGEVHEDGKIIGSLTWELRGLLGQGPTDQLVWGAVSLLTKGASLQDFAASLVDTAAGMEAAGLLDGDQLHKINAALDARGLFDCGRSLSLNKGPRSVKMRGLGYMGKYFGLSCEQAQAKLGLTSSFQFTFRAGAGATRARIRASLEAVGEGGLSWSLLVNKGRPVGFHPGAGGYPEADEADFSVTDQTGPSAEVALGDGTSFPLDPDATYHAVLFQKNCADARLLVEAAGDGDGAEAPAAGPAGPGADPGPSSDDQAGGSTGLSGISVDDVPRQIRCSAGAPASPASPAGLAALLALIAARLGRRSGKTPV